MKQIISRLVFAIIFAAGLLGPGAAHAHDGDPRVEISADRLAPGLVLEVRGVNLAPEESITVSLVGAAGEFTLGTVTGNEHGDFTQAFAVPVDLPEGVYKVLTRSAGQLVVSAPLAITGPAVIVNEEGGQREQEEPLLATLPPDWGQTQVQSSLPPAPAATLAPTQVEAESAPAPMPQLSWLAPVLLVFVLAAVGAILAARWRAANAR